MVRSMKLSGTGRILFWSGGSLWIGHSGEPTDFHSHHAVQIALSLAQDGIQFQCPDGEWNTYNAAIIAAHQLHAFEARGKYVAMIFVEPESREGQALQQLCVADGIAPVAEGTLSGEVAAIFACYKNNVDDAELIAASRAVVARLTSTINVPLMPLDKRIKRAIDIMRERVGGTILLSDIADAAHLSPDRFRHLFVEETGIRFRPYVLWLRIEIALAAYAANKSLTEASHAGGFADSAHFSRTFKNMFGIAPSSIQID